MPQGLPSHKRMLRREGILVAKGRRSGRRWARDAGFARLHPLLLQCKKASTRTISGHEQAAAATITSFLRTISSFTQQEEREREREREKESERQREESERRELSWNRGCAAFLAPTAH